MPHETDADDARRRPRRPDARRGNGPGTRGRPAPRGRIHVVAQVPAPPKGRAATPAGGDEEPAEEATEVIPAPPRQERAGALHRRRRTLISQRQEAVYHLGGLAFELYRRDLLSEEVMRRRAGEIAMLDDTVRDIDIRSARWTASAVSAARGRRATSPPVLRAMPCALPRRGPLLLAVRRPGGARVGRRRAGDRHDRAAAVSEEQPTTGEPEGGGDARRRRRAAAHPGTPTCEVCGATLDARPDLLPGVRLPHPARPAVRPRPAHGGDRGRRGGRPGPRSRGAGVRRVE